MMKVDISPDTSLALLDEIDMDLILRCIQQGDTWQLKEDNHIYFLKYVNNNIKIWDSHQKIIYYGDIHNMNTNLLKGTMSKVKANEKSYSIE